MDADKMCIRDRFFSLPDEECNNADNIEWMNNLRTDDNKEAFTQCIAFESSFRSPKKGGGAWAVSYTHLDVYKRQGCRLATFGYDTTKWSYHPTGQPE